MPVTQVLNRTWASSVLTILLDNLDPESIRGAQANPLYQLWRAAKANDPGAIARVLQRDFGYPSGRATSMAPTIDAVAT